MFFISRWKEIESSLQTFDIAAKDAFILEARSQCVNPPPRFDFLYSHFFHLKIQYGTIAAHSIMISAIG